MIKLLYDNLLQYWFRSTNFYDIRSIIEKYYVFDTEDTGKELMIFKDAKGNIDIYYKNIHISIKDDGRDKVVRIFIKKNGEDWAFDGDFRKPTNVTVEIYTWYYVIVFETDRCTNEHFESGAWNKYVYRTLKELVRMINGMQTKNQIALSYKK